MKAASFAKLFDHSIVRPNATKADVVQAAETALVLRTASLTVQHHYIQLAAELLKGSGVLVGTVVGFPHGNETAAIKAYQAGVVLQLGAQEIDMVMNIPALKNSEKKLFMEDIQGVVKVANGAIVKVITENCYLTQDEKRKACQWIAESGAQYVKTATAYGEGGATLDDVRLMYKSVAGKCHVKAAGGIREVTEILEYLKAGARRFGSTRTQQFVHEFRELPRQAKEEFSAFLEVTDAS